MHTIVPQKMFAAFLALCKSLLLGFVQLYPTTNSLCSVSDR